MDFVDGTMSMPKEDYDELMNRRRCNTIVQGWLVSSMEKEIKSSVKYATITCDIWVDLEECFGKENAPRAYELRRTVTTIQQGDMYIFAYYTKLRSVWDEIQSLSLTPSCVCRGCKCDVDKEFMMIR
uniref:Retrotransposon gag domain-containing protein n=1 Tax=Lactuca sativa TaxID=4236 RepID=A0A9R1WGX1_LACSA|nr:hypothetical protein LSAT_V11C100003040 [Lactuca sativa]